MSSISLPPNVANAIFQLDPTNQGIVTEYISELLSTISSLRGDKDDAPPENPSGLDEALPQYVSGEDYEEQSTCKSRASDLVSEGRYAEALDQYHRAVQAAPPSALLYAARATVLLQLGHSELAQQDCNKALSMNPDSAKALRVRGKARKAMGHWEEALLDLSQAQQIDYDEGTVADLKECSEKHVEAERARASSKVEEEEKLRKRAEEIRRAREEEAKAAAPKSAPRNMPTGAGMGSMPGMPPGFMDSLLSDPELATAMQNPKVVAAFSELMSGPGGPMGLLSNPSKLQKLMMDPDVGPVLQKLLAKFGGGMGGGMPGGMPGSAASTSDDLEDLPDMDQVPDLD
jgi:suppressor of tumorigenicity protein 13